MIAAGHFRITGLLASEMQGECRMIVGEIEGNRIVQRSGQAGGRRLALICTAAAAAVAAAAVIAFAPRGADAPPPAAPTVAARKNGASTVYVLGADPWRLYTVDPAAGTIRRLLTLKHDALQMAFTPDGRTMIAMGSDGSRLIDARTGAVGGTVPLLGAPNAMQLSPNGSTVYLLGRVAPGELRLIAVSVADGRAAAPVDVGQSANDIVLSPDGRTLFVVDPGQVSMSRDGTTDYGPGRLTALDTATGRAGRPVVLPGYLQRLVFTPDGRTAYVITGKTVTPLDMVTTHAKPAIEVPGDPVDIASDGRTVYVLCEHATIEGGETVVAPIDVATATLRAPITVTGVGDGASRITIAPGAGRAYIYGGEDGGGDASTMGWIDTTTDTAGPPVKVSGAPYQIDFSRDATTTYVLTEKFLLPVDTASGAPGKPVKLPRDSVAIAAR
jgi:DNA-binding beta-propeller fold protein YncE